MNDTYIPGFSNALQHLAVGGTVTPGTSAFAPLGSQAARAAVTASEIGMDPSSRSSRFLQQPTYDPETQAYIDAVNAYAASQSGPFGSFSSALPLAEQVVGPAGQNLSVYTDPSVLRSYIDKPAEQSVQYTFNVPVDSGSGSGLVSVGYNTPVYLVNPKTGEQYAGGVGFDAAKDVAAKARELSVGQGRNANWEIYTGAPGSTDPNTFTRQAVDDPNKGVIGKIGDALKVIAPIAVQFIPGVGQALSFGAKGALGAGLGAGVGAGLARTGAGIISGDSLGESLKAGLTTGALSGLTAGALNGLGVGVGGGMPGGLPSPDQIISATNASLAGTALPNIAGSALGSTAGSTAANVLGNEIIVPGIKNAISGIAGGLSAGAGGVLSNVVNGVDTATGEIVAAGNKAPPVDPTAGALGAGVGNVVNGVDTATGEIVATANKPPASVADNTTIPPLVPFTGDVPLGQTPELSTEVDSGLSTVDKLRLGLLGAGLLGGAAGGGGSGTIPAGLGGGQSPIFSAKLPAANLPVATPRTASDMGNIDYYRYGYGPEQSFFSNVPQGAPNTSKAYTGYEEREGLAVGGQPRTDFAVGGPGDGREDKIPAMLSDGEYVIDAETVAMLGNGSNKAGAKALDSFRVNVRKHKGHKLAKGEFSRDAKRPEQYLKGRK